MYMPGGFCPPVYSVISSQRWCLERAGLEKGLDLGWYGQCLCVFRISPMSLDSLFPLSCVVYCPRALVLFYPMPSFALSD